MAALRTQIYLTAEQRRELDSLSKREGTSLAELIREAVDEYLEMRPADLDGALAASFGALPDAAAAARAEWSKRDASGG